MKLTTNGNGSVSAEDVLFAKAMNGDVADGQAMEITETVNVLTKPATSCHSNHAAPHWDLGVWC